MRFRPERIASVVQQVIGEAISIRLADPRISRLASVTRVQVSKDLGYADVYISVMGEDVDARTTLRGLEAAHGKVQGMVAAALPIRQVPILRFRLDESIKKGFETIQLIEKSMEEIRQREAERAALADAKPDDLSDNTSADRDEVEPEEPKTP
jgi:ribosome-binding factor A